MSGEPLFSLRQRLLQAHNIVRSVRGWIDEMKPHASRVQRSRDLNAAQATLAEAIDAHADCKHESKRDVADIDSPIYWCEECGALNMGDADAEWQLPVWRRL